MSAARLTLAFTLGALFTASSGPTHVAGQARTPDATGALQVPDQTERGLDPLGLDDRTGRELDEAAKRLEAARKQAAIAPPPSAERGNVLTAIPGVSETGCAIQVRLSAGLAFVSVALRFESRSVQPAALAYRLSVPAQSALAKLTVCQRNVCTQAGVVGQGARSSDGARVSAQRIVDGQGPALALEAESVDKSAPLELKLEYVAAAPFHGGVARFQLPARGYDPRIGDAELTVTADHGLVAPGFEGALRVDPARAIELRAELAPKQISNAHSAKATCGGAPCQRTFKLHALTPAHPRETWLLLDASPSMEGNARNRADVLLSALLASMPAESPLRVVAFAARAHELGRYSAQSAPLKPLSDALVSDLGGASQPAVALGALRGRPLVLIVSDGKLDAAALRGLKTARERGAELWLLNVGDQPLAGPFEGVVDVTHDAAAVFGSAGSEQLEELLRAPFAGKVEGTRRGEERIKEQARRDFTPRSGESWLSFWLSRTRPVTLAVTGPSRATIAAPPYTSSAPPAPPVDTGMPKESVLSMLRTQLIPQARACLRVDRKGRADYAVQVVFHALFADRESYDVRVEGKLQEALRSCLMDVVAKLKVPAFSGRIRVRYPIHTEREQESPVIELLPEASQAVDRVLREP